VANEWNQRGEADSSAKRIHRRSGFFGDRVGGKIVLARAAPSFRDAFGAAIDDTRKIPRRAPAGSQKLPIFCGPNVPGCVQFVQPV
jgi:hypothetical protein